MVTQHFTAILVAVTGAGLVAANWDLVAGAYMVRYLDATSWSFMCF